MIKNWTVLVYMGVDDDDDAELAAAAFEDLKEMRKIGSSDRVNIAVQMDLHLFQPVRFLIRPDGTADVNKKRGLGLRRESSAGRPGTLFGFLKWATENAPARHYLLILWGHGLGVGFSVEIEATNADVVFDAEDGLTIPELAGILRRFHAINGRALDLLGFDACYMSSAELAYEYDGLVTLMIGSQIMLPFQGWPYDSVLRYLLAHPRVTPTSLSKAIAREVVLSYPDERTVTQTTLCPAKADGLATAVTRLATALESAGRSKTEARYIRRAFTGARYLGARQFLDLKDLCHRLARTCRHQDVRASARAAVRALVANPNGFVADHRRRGGSRGLNGASIYVNWVKARQGEQKVNLQLADYRRLRFCTRDWLAALQRSIQTAPEEPLMPSVNLHLRTIVPPDVTVAKLIDSCRKVFEQAKTTINVRSHVELKLSNADLVKFTAVKVHNCCAGNSLTTEQSALYTLASGIDAEDVVVFLVQDTDKAMDGCAQHPKGRPGAIVTSICSKWTLAHELGHLFALEHVNERSRLMFNRGTLGITSDPPVLTNEEIELLLKSDLVHK